MPRQAEIQAAAPILGRDFIDRTGGPRNVDAADQSIEPAELLRNHLEKACNPGFIRDVGAQGQGILMYRDDLLLRLTPRGRC